jgi:hypothetical protein
MCHIRFSLLCLISLLAPFPLLVAQNISEAPIRETLLAHALPLHQSGEALLLNEARKHQYFLLGELHGEVEIPALLGDLWPRLWNEEYRHVAAEVSPWAAHHLQQSQSSDPTPIRGLWTREQAAVVNKFAAQGQQVLWGCDIEELEPGRLISDLAKINPRDAQLRRMAEVVAQGYNRKQAPELLLLAESEHPVNDAVIGGESLWTNLQDTLRVEALRSDQHSRFAASEAREHIMKELFLAHSKQEPQGKVLLRFGRNHLHRGYDARGISTLGNFVTEWALAQGNTVFNVGVFAAGGKEHLLDKTFDADERQDEATFALLAGLAGADATVFDLRPLRAMLHAIPSDKRTALETNLTYWADSYDFLLCYPMVSPLKDDPGATQNP